MPNAFAAHLAAHHGDLDGYLLSFFEDKAATADLETYLYGPLRAFCANGGKRHRPLICLIAAAAVGGDPARARSAAARPASTARWARAWPSTAATTTSSS